ARLVYKLKATTDCLILTNLTCALNIPLTGSISGVGGTSGIVFEGVDFIQGYKTVGGCQGEPISEPILIGIDRDTYVAANCAGVDPVQVFTFCNIQGENIPFQAIRASFPTGSR